MSVPGGPVRSATDVRDDPIAKAAATLYRLTDELPAKYRAEAVTCVAALVALAERAEQERADANRRFEDLRGINEEWRLRKATAEARVAELELDLAEAMEGWRNNAKACANGSVELAHERERVAELKTALDMAHRIATRGVGPDTSPEEALATIAAYIEKRRAAGSPTGQEQQA